MIYRFHPAAEAEFLESVGYYESKIPGLGSALISEFELLADLISKNPKAWQLTSEPGFRKAPLRRFPFVHHLP